MIFRREIGEKGQVVIPADIRQMFNLRVGSSIIFDVTNEGIIVKPQQSPEDFVEDFLNVPKLKKSISAREMKKILEEEYEVP